MTKRAAIAGVYSDLKTVKTRSVCQIVVEVPIERGKEIVDAFGFPQPGSEVHVAIARLNGEAGSNPNISANAPSTENPVSPTKQKFEDLPLTQQAVLLCKREAFRRYIQVENEEAAKEWLYDNCNVSSRSEIIEGNSSGDFFLDLYGRFQDWLDDPDAQAWEDDWEAGV